MSIRYSMIFGIVGLKTVIDRGRRKRFGRIVRRPSRVSKSLSMSDIGVRIGLRVVLEEEVRRIGVGRIGGKGDNATSPGGVHGAGVGKRRAPLVVSGSGRYGHGFGGVEDIVVEDAVDVFVEVTLLGV